MPDPDSTSGNAEQSSITGQHQELSLGDQTKGDNLNEYNFEEQDQQRLDSLRWEDGELFQEEIQAQYTAAESAERERIKMEKGGAAEAVTTPAKSAAQSLSKPNSTIVHPSTDASSLTG